MKKQFISAISALTLGVLLTTAVTTTQAQSTIGSPSEKTAEVKYLGLSDDALFFNVSFENPVGGRVSVIVLDEDGTQLFQEVYTDKKFDKRFKLPKLEKNKITFVIRNFKDTDVKQSFEINTRLVEDVVVTKQN
ncbi:MAG TPA: hypothetical protein VGZ71_04455 [Puia sp.]|jgi:hypothetical protein|nr:hypothetical protein [Puia sp.]